MIMTPQARRRITSATHELPDAARDRWNAWLRQNGPMETVHNVPYPVADVALQALTASAREIERRLGQDDLHEDVRSDLLNDLGFVRAIEGTIRAEHVDY